MVKILILDKRVDPSVDINYAIRSVSKKGYANIVSLLVLDKSVNPSDDNNYVIGMASYFGRDNIV